MPSLLSWRGRPAPTPLPPIRPCPRPTAPPLGTSAQHPVGAAGPRAAPAFHTMRPQRRGVPGGAGPGAAPGGRPAAGRLCRADLPVRLHARRPARGCVPACLHWHAGGCLPALARYTKGGGRTELLLVGAAAGGAVRGPCAAGLLVRRPAHAASPRALPACRRGTTCLAVRWWSAPGHPATPQATSWCGRSPTRSGRCCSAGWAAVPRHSWCCWTTGCMCPQAAGWSMF